MINVPKFKAAVDALAWRHGCTRGDEVTHRAEADGSHVITIVIPAMLVDQEKLPKPPEKAASWGMTTPDISKGGH